MENGVTDNSGLQPAGWYYAQGDPPGTHRYWDGTAWVGGPQAITAAPGVGQVADATGQAQLASLGQRIGARIIDGIILGIFNAIVSSIVIGTAGFTTDSSFDTPGFGFYLFATLIGIGFGVLYEGFLVSKTEATLGKMMLGLQIKRTDGSKVSLEDAIKRYAIWGGVALLGVFGASTGISLLSGLLSLGLVIAGMVMINSDKLSQAPWDKVADTIVVKKG